MCAPKCVIFIRLARALLIIIPRSSHIKQTHARTQPTIVLFPQWPPPTGPIAFTPQIVCVCFLSACLIRFYNRVCTTTRGEILGGGGLGRGVDQGPFRITTPSVHTWDWERLMGLGWGGGLGGGGWGGLWCCQARRLKQKRKRDPISMGAQSEPGTYPHCDPTCVERWREKLPTSAQKPFVRVRPKPNKQKQTC